MELRKRIVIAATTLFTLVALPLGTYYLDQQTSIPTRLCERLPVLHGAVSFLKGAGGTLVGQAQRMYEDPEGILMFGLEDNPALSGAVGKGKRALGAVFPDDMEKARRGLVNNRIGDLEDAIAAKQQEIQRLQGQLIPMQNDLKTMQRSLNPIYNIIPNDPNQFLTPFGFANRTGLDTPGLPGGLAPPGTPPVTGEGNVTTNITNNTNPTGVLGTNGQCVCP